MVLPYKRTDAVVTTCCDTNQRTCSCYGDLLKVLISYSTGCGMDGYCTFHLFSFLVCAEVAKCWELGACFVAKCGNYYTISPFERNLQVMHKASSACKPLALFIPVSDFFKTTINPRLSHTCTHTHTHTHTPQM